MLEQEVNQEVEREERVKATLEMIKTHKKQEEIKLKIEAQNREIQYRKHSSSCIGPDTSLYTADHLKEAERERSTEIKGESEARIK